VGVLPAQDAEPLMVDPYQMEVSGGLVSFAQGIFVLRVLLPNEAFLDNFI
jgi:hypothetical protein